MDDLHRALRLEVKTSRGSGFTITTRDLQGIAPDGYVAALVLAPVLGGPRWLLVPSVRLSPGRLSEQAATRSEEPSEHATLINVGWSDWMLDQAACGRLLAEAGPVTRERVQWCRAHHPPNPNKSVSQLRNARLGRCLAAFEAAVDQRSQHDRGAQQEGSIHQLLLEDVLTQAGYRIVPNAVGVPDITAVRSM